MLVKETFLMRDIVESDFLLIRNNKVFKKSSTPVVFGEFKVLNFFTLNKEFKQFISILKAFKYQYKLSFVYVLVQNEYLFNVAQLYIFQNVVLKGLYCNIQIVNSFSQVSKDSRSLVVILGDSNSLNTFRARSVETNSCALLNSILFLMSLKCFRNEYLVSNEIDSLKKLVFILTIIKKIFIYK